MSRSTRSEGRAPFPLGMSESVIDVLDRGEDNDLRRKLRRRLSILSVSLTMSTSTASEETDLRNRYLFLKSTETGLLQEGAVEREEGLQRKDAEGLGDVELLVVLVVAFAAIQHYRFKGEGKPTELLIENKTRAIALRTVPIVKHKWSVNDCVKQKVKM